MFKKDRIEVAQYVGGEYVFASDAQNWRKAAGISTIVTTLYVPATAMAASGTFNTIYSAAVKAVDAGVVFVFMVGGVAWMIGKRGKMLEIMLGASAGYLVFRNAVHIRDFLRTLVPDTGVL